jgi:PAS domain S-box-containing protein
MDRTAEIAPEPEADESGPKMAGTAVWHGDHFARLVEALPTALLLVSRDGVIRMVNRLAEQMFGHDRDRLVGGKVEMLLPERLRGQHDGLRAGFFAHPATRAMGGGRDLAALRGDGTEFPVEIGLHPVTLESEWLVLAAVTDITERRRKDDELRCRDDELLRLNAELRHYQVIVEAFDDAIVSKDLNGRITSWNAGAEALFGYTAQEVMSAPMILIPPERVAEEREVLLRIATGKRVDHLHTLRRCKDGRVLEVSVTMAPLHDTAGRVIGASTIARDITEREQRRRDLERSNTDLAEFACIASHDLKAPLQAIGHLAEWITEDLQDKASPETRESLTLLRGRVRRLQGLLNALLAYSRVGRERHRIERVDIPELVAETVDMLGVPAGFTVHCGGEMPVLHTRRAPLRHTLQNLIGNAVRHHDLDSGVIRITAQNRGAFVEFAVSDDGPGIPPQFHERIFKIFQTLLPRDDIKASGVGLAIVKKMVEDHGGTVQVESAPPARGTRFVFTWKEARS